MQLTSQDILSYLSDKLGIDDRIDIHTPLFSSSMIDSFQMMSLVEYIEKRCGFRVAPDDVTLENLDTVERMLAYASGRSPRP
jgi:acyl carrier protein